MSLSRSHKRRRILLFVDGVSLTLSYIVMITLRFQWYFKREWMIPLYSMLFIMEILFATLVNVYRGRSLDYKPIEDSDPLEVFVEFFKNQVILFVFMLVVLMATKNTQLVSRLAMGILVITNFVFVFTFRMLYRAILIKSGNPEFHRRKIAALVYSPDINAARAHLEKELGLEFSLEGIHPLDEAYPEAGIRLSNEDAVIKKREELVDAVRNSGCSDVFICIPDKLELADFVRNDLVRRFGNVGINTYYALSMDGQWITGNLIRELGYYQATYYTAMVKRCNVLGVNFAVSNVENAVRYVRSHIRDFFGKYICFCNVHTTVEASENADYMKIQNSSALTFPDGQPIVNRIQKAGYVKAERIAGPDFMEAMFNSTMDGKLSHFFYGSSEETIALLKEKLPERFPGMDIRGFYSPPFRELTEAEDEEIVEMLNSSGADLVWIGLGAPKQEKWMAAHEGKIHGVMLGVGAGFNFFAGNIKRAPRWVRKIGMEWLYRLFQDPKRLFKRYFESNIKFIWKAIFMGK
ncbi:MULTISPECIES: WecB/TagA/CpsF family glycosyltransferase [unclassified Butyrivibrio]|uniref:WecB/TagA/CpsF family glycosyltransferase n=1 Tax=unclassified Butyrivibrio TaxID=2639466 RepID=UPI0003B72BDF|nr:MULTISPECIES: WecB/TagA/CpsF family glycosyltransferase [unclassified Butyrivibrio]